MSTKSQDCARSATAYGVQRVPSSTCKIRDQLMVDLHTTHIGISNTPKIS